VSNDLNPLIRAFDFSIPAVVGIMGHLLGLVLAEADGLGFDATGDQEHVSASHEVSEGLVFDKSLSDGLTDS